MPEEEKNRINVEATLYGNVVIGVGTMDDVRKKSLSPEEAIAFANRIIDKAVLATEITVHL